MKHIILSLATALIAQTASAQAQRNCAPRDIVIARLADRYGETLQSIGLGTNNSLIETYASLETGSWSITMTMANGITCLMANGQAFDTVAQTLPTTKSGA